MKSEEWTVPLTFEETKAYLQNILPIGDSFDDAPFLDVKQGLDVDGLNQIDWRWARNPDRVLTVHVREMPERLYGIAGDQMVMIQHFRE